MNAYLRPAQIPLRGGQVLLGQGRHARGLGDPIPFGLFRLGPVNGPNAAFSIPLPLKAALVGTSLTLQATHTGGPGPFALSNAVDLVLGF